MSYRDAELYLRDRRDELIAQREAELENAWPEVSRVYARRIGRIAAGWLSIGGAVLLVVFAVWRYVGGAATNITLTPILLGSVVLAPLAYAAGWAVAHVALRFQKKGLELTGNAIVDLAHLEHDTRRTSITRRASRLERASVATTLAGWALLMPLTLHFLVALTQFESWSDCVRSFDGWIDASLVLTGVAHLTLVFLGWRYADKLRAWDHEREDAPGGPWSAWGWTILASCVPGIIALGIPPMIVALTGVLFIPATFTFMRWRVSQERFVLAATRTREDQ
ncbi:MAG: hypothetical protein JWM74_4582 [Myxococcaceae bacterium]|nr:hypothetical protein [Myxococcaceae bacterium]